MSTTWSTNLGIALIGTGEQAGTWGATTNTNLGTLIEQAISGYVTQAITDGGDTTITLPDGATGVARNMCLELTGALNAARTLIVPAKKKLYFIYNNTSDGGSSGPYAVTVKVTGQTGISVPNGKKMVLVCNGADVFVATNHLVGTVTGNVTGNLTGNVTGNASGTAANVTGTVAIANGGTGATTAGTARAALLPTYAGNTLKVLRVNAGETDVEYATITSSADVAGPGASTDNAVTRFDSTTGKLLQNSAVFIDDSGRLTIGSGIQSTYDLSVTGLSALLGTVTLGLSSANTVNFIASSLYYGGAGVNVSFQGTSHTSVLTLSTTNYVGIRNTTPSYPLDVTGVIRSTAEIYTQTSLEVGYRKVPRVTWTGGTAGITAVGKCYGMTTGGITIPASTFAEGDVFSLFNDSSSAQTISRGSGLALYLAGTDKATVTIAAHCLATVWFNSNVVAVITGSGLS